MLLEDLIYHHKYTRTENSHGDKYVHMGMLDLSVNDLKIGFLCYKCTWISILSMWSVN